MGCLQALASYPKIQSRFSSRSEFHQKYEHTNVDSNPVSNLEFQTRKLFSNVTNGSPTPLGEHVRIRPRDFKKVIGKDHQEFSTCGQQDAQEFFSHFLDRVDKYSDQSENNPRQLFRFQVEERLKCTQSNKYRKLEREEVLLQLPVSKDDCIDNKIDFTRSLTRYFADENIDEFNSPATGQKGRAEKSVRMKTMPENLFVQMGKFYFDANLQPKKHHDIEIIVPNELTLEPFRNSCFEAISKEMMLPEEAPIEVSVDMVKVNQLMEMGFGIYACKRAIHATNDVMSGMEWLFNHQED